MDSFCIDRGTLLDNPSLVTLENPDKHSVHCLVDISSCRTSPFEILIEPYAENQKTLHSRGWRLDGSGRDKIVELARSVGHTDGCTTCTGNNLMKGFRAAVTAKVISLNLDNELLVPSIEIVGDPVFSVNLENACQTQFGITDILEVLKDTEKDLLFSNSADSSFRRKQIAHGSMMLIGWGFLLPLGAIFARFFKHRPNGIWFKIHRLIQSIGLVFSLTGWIIALVNFDVFQDRDMRFVHGLVGSIVMALGLLQPVNAILRPHLPPGGSHGDKTKRRIIWEYYHKGAGWTAIFLAFFVVVLGTTMLAEKDDRLAFQITFGIVILTIIGFSLFSIVDRKRNDKTDDDKEEMAGITSES